MPAKKQPLIVELEQTHNCFAIDVSDKLKDVRMKWLATVGEDEKTISSLYEVPASELNKAIKRIKQHPHVKEVNIVQKGGKTALITIKHLRKFSTAPYLVKTGVAWIPPSWSEKGVDKVTMVAPSFKNLKEFIGLVGEKGYDLKIKSKRYLEPKESVSLDLFRASGFTKLKCASELLTDRQMEVFDLACRHGYYEEPKKITIAELAQKLGISEGTCAELLRKAERKLLPILNEVIGMIR
ncbi:helix-turn-helix domain-containing protein [Candidatus Micrarchaeota archaeon]|nr:helix-turn-helix domain-containing protein [Candidatus Micrarchaeota archaeon]